MIAKCLLIFALLTSPCSFADVSGVTATYALDCPGQTSLISSVRRRLEKNGTPLSPKFATFREEYQFYGNKIWTKTNNLQESYFQNQEIPANPEPETLDFGTVIKWKQGISIENSAAGLPDTEDGCHVVPLFVESSDEVPYPQKTQIIGSSTDFDRMSPLDRVLTVFAGEDLDTLVFFLTDKYDTLSFQQKLDRGHSLQFDGVEINNPCTWFDDQHPIQCVISSIENPDSSTPIQFWPNGYYKSFSVIDYGPLGLGPNVVRNQANPGNLFYCYKQSAVYYRNDGSLSFCWNQQTSTLFLFDLSGKPLVSLIGPDDQENKIHNLGYTGSFDHVVLDSDGNVVGQNAYELGFSNIPSLSAYTPASSSFFLFHKNGQFKSGVVSNPNLPGDSPGYARFLIETNDQGVIVKTREAAPGKYFQQQELNLANSKDIPTVYPLYDAIEVEAVAWDSACQGSPQISNNQITVSPGCSGVFRVLREFPE